MESGCSPMERVDRVGMFSFKSSHEAQVGFGLFVEFVDNKKALQITTVICKT